MNDSTILHYRVLRELGSGGMGVVHEAEDLNLGRRVALKFLPESLAGDDAARERFLREARAASALNHPNICTIYAVERDGGRHFIAMELLEGDPLDRRLLAGAMPVEALLDIAIQISDALDAAHQAGIVHRDIKPGNIFLTRSGRVKVLDFGLAKFARSELANAVAADGATVDRSAPHLTSPGSTVGTIAFMSPEQARGEELDARSDLFSFGSVLYQMATGVLPFSGATSAVIFTGILKEAPVPPLRRNAALPPKLGDVIERALEKDRDLRYQSAAEMRSELKRLKRDTTSGKSAVAVPIVSNHAAAETRAGAPAPRDSVSAPAPHDSVSAPAAHASGSSVIAAAAKEHKVGIALALVVALAVLAAAGFGIYSLLHRATAPNLAANITYTPLTTSGNVSNGVAISSDGRYVVYCLDERPKRTLWVKQVATGSTVKIAEYTDQSLWGVTFSPDGDFLYLTLHTTRPSNRDLYRISKDLYRIPTLGGESRLVMTKVDSPVSFSPDGKQIAFVRVVSSTVVQLVVASPDGGGERVIATGNVPGGWFRDTAVAWTPDGQQIVASWISIKGRVSFEVVAVNVSDGSMKPLIDRKWKSGLGGITALADHSGIVFPAEDIDKTYQFWFSDYSGHARQLTHDQNDYGHDGLAVTADTKTGASLQRHDFSNLAAIDNGGTGQVHPLTKEDTRDGTVILEARADGSALYTSWRNGRPVLMYLAAGSTNPSLVTDSEPIGAVLSPDGKFVVFSPLEFDLRRINTDGSGPRHLVNGSTNIACDISADGQWVWFAHFDPGKPGVIQKMPADGSSAPQTVAPGESLRISPDGRSLLVSDNNVYSILSIDGKLQKTIQLPPHALSYTLRWMPDSQGVSFVVSADGAHNVWSMPLAGGSAKQITHFKDGDIYNFAWAAQTNQLIVARGHNSQDVVLIRDWR